MRQVFVNPHDKPVRHDLGEDTGWVDLRPKLSVGDRSLINQATVTGKITTRRGDKALELGQLQLGASYTQTLIQAIVDWGGPAFEGVPCIPENIIKLADDVGKELAAVIEDLNPDPEEGSSNPTGRNATSS